MIPMAEEIIGQTESVCPECLARIPAARVQRGQEVYLVKSCREHGKFETVIWRGPPAFTSWLKPKIPFSPRHPSTAVERGCPFDCGLCPDHRQESCCVLLEVTQRCDLKCPVCFADAGAHHVDDPDLSVIEGWYRQLLAVGGPYNIQLSGGEPCLRDDLPDIIALGRSLGFTFFQINTNGRRLARDLAFVERLKAAGASTIFLQFDGTYDHIYSALRGRPLLAEKRAAIENCIGRDLGVVLVPTVVPGVNVFNIGGILRFALEYAPWVRGVHFQPISYFGRSPQEPDDEMRITIPEILRRIETQTQGMFKTESFCPPGGENAWCSFHGNFVLMPDGTATPLTRRVPEASSCCQPVPAQVGAAKSREFVARHWSSRGPVIPLEPKVLPVEPKGPSLGSWELESPSLGGWEIVLERSQTHLFCISGMAFQDAWTIDLERLRDCYIHTAGPDGKLVPFCAYNLTDRRGRALYRHSFCRPSGPNPLPLP